MIYLKSGKQTVADSPLTEWGSFVRYLEIADDGFASRQLDVFVNGCILAYDRESWCDAESRLADKKFDARTHRERQATIPNRQLLAFCEDPHAVSSRGADEKRTTSRSVPTPSRSLLKKRTRQSQRSSRQTGRSRMAARRSIEPAPHHPRARPLWPYSPSEMFRRRAAASGCGLRSRLSSAARLLASRARRPDPRWECSRLSFQSCGSSSSCGRISRILKSSVQAAL